jgi:HD-like signal output (HDOD) protein
MDAKLVQIIQKKVTSMKVSVFSLAIDVLKKYQIYLIKSGVKPENISVFNDFKKLQQNFSAHLLLIDYHALTNQGNNTESFFQELAKKNIINIALVYSLKDKVPPMIQKMATGKNDIEFRAAFYLTIAKELLAQKKKKIEQPQKPDSLTINKLINAYCSKDDPTSDELKFAYQAIKGISMPTMPEMALKVRDELSILRPDMKKIADYISRDAGLSGNVLKIINSPAFGLTKKITSIEHASVLLGIDKIKNTVIASAFKSVSGSGDKNKKVRSNIALDSSVIAFCCARLSTYVTDVTQDEAYMAGLFHNGGLLIMVSQHDKMEELVDYSMNFPISMISKEYEKYYSSHTVIGYLLGKHWELPEVVSQAIYLHHIPSTEMIDNPELRGLVSILIAANGIMNKINGYRDKLPQEAGVYYDEALSELMIDEDTLEQIEIETSDFMQSEASQGL